MMRQPTKNDKYQVWRHNLPPQLLPTFKSISRIICKMGHLFKRFQIQMGQRDNLSFRSEIYVQYIQYIQIKFYFTDRNIYYGNNLCVAVSRFDTTCQYQLLSSSLSHSPKYYNTQITASIYAKNSTHLKRALSMPIMQMVDVFVFILVLCVVLGSSHSQRQIHQAKGVQPLSHSILLTPAMHNYLPVKCIFAFFPV